MNGPTTPFRVLISSWGPNSPSAFLRHALVKKSAFPGVTLPASTPLPPNWAIDLWAPASARPAAWRRWHRSAVRGRTDERSGRSVAEQRSARQRPRSVLCVEPKNNPLPPQPYPHRKNIPRAVVKKKKFLKIISSTEWFHPQQQQKKLLK